MLIYFVDEKVCPVCGKMMDVGANESDYFYACDCGCMLEVG